MSFFVIFLKLYVDSVVSVELNYFLKIITIFSTFCLWFLTFKNFTFIILPLLLSSLLNIFLHCPTWGKKLLKCFILNSQMRFLHTYIKTSYFYFSFIRTFMLNVIFVNSLTLNKRLTVNGSKPKRYHCLLRLYLVAAPFLHLHMKPHVGKHPWWI